MRALAPKLLTVDEFLYRFAGVEGRWELAHGVPVMMAGGTINHGIIAARIISALNARLDGAPCVAVGSDVGIQIDVRQYRLPDVSVLCDPRDLEVDGLDRAHFPTVLFEVFSPSTAERDRGEKLLEYRRLPSVQAIVHIDPETHDVDLYERVDEKSWSERRLAPDEDLALPSIGVLLTRVEIFRRVVRTPRPA